MNLFKLFRITAILEGVSYIALMGICMPLKYMMDIPEPTYGVGMAHGILFVAYCLLLLIVGMKYKFTLMEFFLSFVASLLPFGTFIADKKLFTKKRL